METLSSKIALPKQWPYSELFWSVFSYMRENADQSRITPNMDTFYVVQISIEINWADKSTSSFEVWVMIGRLQKMAQMAEEKLKIFLSTQCIKIRSDPIKAYDFIRQLSAWPGQLNRNQALMIIRGTSINFSIIVKMLA